MSITLENIKSISHEVLADLVYAQIDNNHVLYGKVEKTLLKSIKKEVPSKKLWVIPNQL